MARRALGVLLIVTSVSTAAQESRFATIPPAFDGVFQSISDDARAPGGLRNMGSPEDLVLLPKAAEEQKALAAQEDPERRCEPIGPFRMMSRDGITIELVPVPATASIVMLFEDISRGYVRTIRLNRAQPNPREPAWQGYSSARWEGSTLVVETTGFNDRTWLNSKGARHSRQLRLIERIRPIDAGRYLEYQVTAEDPAVLARPHTYVRYFQKTSKEIGESICEVE